MIKVYTKENGNMAVFEVGTDDPLEARHVVQMSLGVKYTNTILAVVEDKNLSPQLAFDF